MNDVESWLSVMTGLVVAYRRPSVDHRALAAHMQNLLQPAAPRFKALGAVKTTVVDLLGIVGKGRAAGKDGMPAMQYATLLVKMRKEMKPQLSRFYHSPDIDERQRNLAKALVALLAPDTATVDRKDANLDRALVILPDRTMRVWFDPPRQHDQNKSLAEATKLVKRWTGRDDSRLTQIETKKIKPKDPQGYKRYLQVRKDVAAAYTTFVRSAARNAGHPVLIGQVIRDMARAGINYHAYDGLEKLYIGENGKLFTPPPYREIVGMPAPGSRIIMNPAYDPKSDEGAVFKYQVPGSKRAENSMSSAYTKTYLRGRRLKRSDVVERAITRMPSLRPRWLRDLRSKDPTTRALAAMTEMAYSQAMRVGGDKNQVDGKTTYGLSTLRVSHVRARNGTLIVSYPGKDAIQQKHVLRPDDPEFPETAQVIKVVLQLMKGKKNQDYIWTDSRGERITASDLRAYFNGKKLGISPHKFRHVRGTVLMKDKLEHLKIPKGMTQPQAEKLVKEAAIDVGALLGHMSGEKVTSGTALRKYILPSVVADFFQRHSLRVPGWVPARSEE